MTLTPLNTSRSALFKILFISATISVLAIVMFAVAQGASTEADHSRAVTPDQRVALSGRGCPWAPSVSNCHYGTPAAADVNNDGKLDAIIATNNGHVYVILHDGSILWESDTAQWFPGVAANTQQIHSSPAAADIDGDGRIEIVVATGAISGWEVGVPCAPGGVIVLDHNGQREANWPQIALGAEAPPAGCPDAIMSTPALGDLDGDGDMEIVAGGIDKRIYAWHHTGALVAGFPPDSKLRQVWAWPNLENKLADTIFSSPALADMTGDGKLEIIIGTDEGDFTFNPKTNWTCDYTMPGVPNVEYCGGSIYGLNYKGEHLPGFPIYLPEALYSSPSVADLDGDGYPEIVVGGGLHYGHLSAEKPSDGYRTFVFDRNGDAFPGWEGGRPTAGPMPATPSIGDIAGDDKLEVVIPGYDGKLYAWHSNGATVAGFPMTPMTFDSTVQHYIGRVAALADIDNDGKMEAAMPVGSGIAVIDGNGQHINPTNDADYQLPGGAINSVTFSDLDTDGNLELLGNHSEYRNWELTSAGSDIDWGTFKANAARTGSTFEPTPFVDVEGISAIVLLQDKDEPLSRVFSLSLELAYGEASGSWTVNAPAGVNVNVTRQADSSTALLTVDARPMGLGTHNLGSVTVSVNASPFNAAGSSNVTKSIPISVQVADFSYIYVPLVTR